MNAFHTLREFYRGRLYQIIEWGSEPILADDDYARYLGAPCIRAERRDGDRVLVFHTPRSPYEYQLVIHGRTQ